MRCHWFAFIACSVVFSGAVPSQHARAAESQEQPAADAASAQESTMDLVRQLDADEFAQREIASRKLTELGAGAVPDLAKAAQGKSLEVSSRAFAILKKFAT